MAPAHDPQREERLVRALHQHQKQGDRQAMALDCYQLGAWHQEEGSLDAAVSMFRRALVLCEPLLHVRSESRITKPARGQIL